MQILLLKYLDYSMASSCVADPVFLMQLIILLVFSCAIAQGSHLQKEWEHWKLKYSKNYTDSADEEASKIVWIENYNRIADHTQANESFHIALNQFSDLVRLYHKELSLNDESNFHLFISLTDRGRIQESVFK